MGILGISLVFGRGISGLCVCYVQRRRRLFFVYNKKKLRGKQNDANPDIFEPLCVERENRKKIEIFIFGHAGLACSVKLIVITLLDFRICFCFLFVFCLNRNFFLYCYCYCYNKEGMIMGKFDRKWGKTIF